MKIIPGTQFTYEKIPERLFTYEEKYSGCNSHQKDTRWDATRFIYSMS